MAPSDPSPVEPGAPLPRACTAVGVVEKLAGYCLAPEHSAGRHKARVFHAALGYERSDAPELAACLVASVTRGAPVVSVRDNAPLGVLCEVRVVISGVRQKKARTATIVTVWELRTPAESPRLVTAYVDV
jgi:hypothetical protein